MTGPKQHAADMQPAAHRGLWLALLCVAQWPFVLSRSSLCLNKYGAHLATNPWPWQKPRQRFGTADGQ
jgi:hypothetical protein